MTQYLSRVLMLSVMILGLNVIPPRADPLTVTTYRGETVDFPEGPISFADAVVSSSQGTPATQILKLPETVLGAPDWNRPDNSTGPYPDLAYSLGCGGHLIVEFIDNALIDVAGPDLYIFEVGIIEPTRLEISNDLITWQDIGRIGGAVAAVDFANFNLRQSSYRYVRFTDLRQACNNISPGADIDAIGGIGSAKRLSLSAISLFDVGSSLLKASAHQDIAKILNATDLKSDRSVVVVGHTEATGSAQDNQALGLRRAKAVAEVLGQFAPDWDGTLVVKTRGESEPRADNATLEGQEKNRRVEIILKP